MTILGIPFFKKKKKEKEFSLIYSKYYPAVYKQLYYMTGNNELAEDITQEVFIKLYSCQNDIENTGSWLSKVASNTALNYIRSQKRTFGREEDAFSKDQPLTMALSPEDIICKDEEISDVRKALYSLPENQRICLILKFSGYSYEEISSASGIPRSNIGQLISRGKKNFLKTYKKEEGDANVL
ncbi:RNA polymerase sigma factor, sigma-70 family [Peptoclostridium litorale DSM 5388]|uniref:RNA polymerase sigma factor, sigma-70 family n=1 Tax=Peptoclostridium litorale DSM 5388 TaxID=1121324 RepID=A0A069RKX8_PEPLI|nr:RNA polymerase sigma factor SigX [Peptoclostridium litorale]KDR96775.1 RNA polymerase sigma factor, sigma-70 family [Peptoclostridium litorale DSM 5388]SIO34530.1 RNA polymerase sigma factor, sigma-70 family [Peptoclostridium litorale DSM 5388]